jgi:zinc protease
MTNGIPTTRLGGQHDGLMLQALENHSLPIVTLAIMLRAGCDQDEPGCSGVSNLTSSALDAGTATSDLYALAERTEFLGTSLHVSAMHDGASILCSTLTRHLDAVVGVIGEILGGASFPDHEVERLRSSQVTTLMQIHDRPGLRAAQALGSLLFGREHAYGRPAAGTKQDLAAMSSADTRTFFRRRYRPSGALAVAAGDITIGEWKSICERHLAGWEGTNAAPLPQPAITTTHTRRIHLIDRPSTPQAEIRMGCISLKRNHPDYLAASVLNHCLGGQFSSRLNKVLREQRGLTYGVWSSFSALRTGGSFVQGGAFQTEKADEALQGLLDEVERIVGEGISMEELLSAQGSMAGNFLRASETGAHLVSRRQAVYLYDLPDDYHETYLERLRGLTREEILRAARRWIQPEAMITVVVGDAAVLRPRLATLHLGDVVDYDDA